LPCGQTCNVGAFERILSVVTSAHAEMSKHGLLDEMITDSVSNPVVEQNSGQEGDASNGGWAAAYEALALGKRSFEDFGMDEIYDTQWHTLEVLVYRHYAIPALFRLAPPASEGVAPCPDSGEGWDSWTYG